MEYVPRLWGRERSGRSKPSRRVNRGQMAVFLVKTFGLQLYGP